MSVNDLSYLVGETLDSVQARIALVFLFAAQLFAGDEITGIQEVVATSIRALSHGDAGTARKLSSADYMLLEKGQIWSLEQELTDAIAVQARGEQRTDQIDFKCTKVTGDSAWTIYILTSSFQHDGQTRLKKWMESAFLQRSKNGWQVALVHSTEIQAQPPVK